ncbi:hypothetical protein GCM10022234_13970 [Aeromicrobium panaciterrae]|uniref:hypothetical protein n=1 Tax=Aeromicrobium panaciterrae TaxID=363861 RepID=UPI0031D3FBB3
MSDAQTWTTIGGMFTFMLAFMAVVVRLFSSTLDAKFGGMDTRFAALELVMTNGFEQVDKRFEQVDKRFEQVDKRFDRLEARVDALDRDVHAITRRLMDGPDPA